MRKNDISNVEIALFSLHELDGATKIIHTEHIAWESYMLLLLDGILQDEFDFDGPRWNQKLYVAYSSSL